MSPCVKPSTVLRQLFSEEVIGIETEIAEGPHPLHPAEANYVSRAVPKRVAQFAAGRACARAALAQFEIRDFPLRVGCHGEPIWPPGFTGSITHTNSYCAAVAAKTTSVRALGIDAEIRGALSRELWPQVITAAERRWLASLPEHVTSDMSTVIFAAKEAFYKCQHQLSCRWVEFLEVDVTCSPGLFCIRPRRGAAIESLPPEPWTGRFALVGTLVVAGVGL